MPSKYASIAGVATHFLYDGPTTLPPEPPRYGGGSPVLFLHGAGGNAAHWRRQMGSLGEKHTSVAADFPAHGRSGATEGLASIEAMGDFADAFAESIRLPPAVLVGTCMGAAAAVAMAAAAPQRWRALVLVAAAMPLRFTSSAVETWREVAHGRAPQPFTTELFSSSTDFGVMRELWMEQVKTDPRVRWTDMVACNAFDASPMLAAIRLPTLIVAGRDDSLIALDQAEALQRRIAGSRLAVLDAAGHCAAYERADDFNELLGAFLREVG